MKFVKLEADNFKSFEHFAIDLDGHGFVKIEGVNNTDDYSKSVGSGKSTIADALSYALVGETIKGNSSINDVKNMYTKGTCRVAVAFTHDGKEYQIVRGENELTLIEDGVNISKHLKKETQALIEEKFPMFTPTFIGATVIIGQNMPNAFTNNKPSARKQILEELTNSSFMIEDIKNRLAEKRSEWQSEVGELTTSNVVFDTKIRSSEGTIARCNERIAALVSPDALNLQLSELLKGLESTKASIEKKRTILDSAVEERDKAQAEVARITEELSSARTRHNEFVMKSVEGLLTKRSELDSALATARAEFRAKEGEISRLRSEISKLKNAPTHCPTCGQALPDAHKIDTTAQEQELALAVAALETLRMNGKELADSVGQVTSEIDAFKQNNKSNEEIDTLSSKLEEANQFLAQCRTNENNVRSSIASEENIISLETQREQRLRLQLNEIDTVRKTCEEDIARAQSEIDEAKKEKETIAEKLEKKQARLSTLNQVIAFATRDFRTILLSSIIARLDAYAKSYCRKMLDTTEIEFKDDGNNIAITYRGRDFGVLSGGESQLVKMCITLALKKTLEDLVGFTTNIVFLDEILDNLDGSTAQQMVELVSALECSSTFFISHHEDVYLPIDKTWTVTKTDRISTLTM